MPDLDRATFVTFCYVTVILSRPLRKTLGLILRPWPSQLMSTDSRFGGSDAFTSRSCMISGCTGRAVAGRCQMSALSPTAYSSVSDPCPSQAS